MPVVCTGAPLATRGLCPSHPWQLRYLERESIEHLPTAMSQDSGALAGVVIHFPRVILLGAMTHCQRLSGLGKDQR